MRPSCLNAYRELARRGQLTPPRTLKAPMEMWFSCLTIDFDVRSAAGGAAKRTAGLAHNRTYNGRSRAQDRLS